MIEATIVWSIVLAFAIIRVADEAGEYVYDLIKRKQSAKNFKELMQRLELEFEEQALKRPVKKAVAKKKPAVKRK